MPRTPDVPRADGTRCDVAFTASVKAAQGARGSRQVYARLEARGGWPSDVTPELPTFVAQIDTASLATASAARQDRRTT